MTLCDQIPWAASVFRARGPGAGNSLSMASAPVVRTGAARAGRPPRWSWCSSGPLAGRSPRPALPSWTSATRMNAATPAASSAPDPRGLADRPEFPPTLAASRAAPVRVEKTRSRSLHVRPAVPARRLAAPYGPRARSPPSRAGPASGAISRSWYPRETGPIATQPRWPARRIGCRIAEVDVLPAQRPGLLGADAGREAQGDICVHPGVLSGGQECRCLFQAEALARPSGLALGGSDEHGDVRPTRSRASACRIARVSAL